METDTWTVVRGSMGGLSDGLYFSVLIEILHGSVFAISTIFFLWCNRSSFFDKYRIRHALNELECS